MVVWIWKFKISMTYTWLALIFELLQTSCWLEAGGCWLEAGGWNWLAGPAPAPASQFSPAERAANFLIRRVRLAYKPYFFSQRIVFFFHIKLVNSTFSHVLSAKQTEQFLSAWQRGSGLSKPWSSGSLLRSRLRAEPNKRLEAEIYIVQYFVRGKLAMDVSIDAAIIYC